MNTAADLLWGLYQEHCTHGRHHEIQRATSANVNLAISAAILGIVGFDKAVDRADLGLCLLLVAVAIVGVLHSMKHYERFRFHMAQAGLCRKRLDEELKVTTLDMRDLAKTDVGKKRVYGWMQNVHLWTFSLALHIVVLILGVRLTQIAWVTAH